VRFAGVLAPNHHEHGLIVVTLELLVHVADFEHGDVEAAKTLAERFEPNKGVSFFIRKRLQLLNMMLETTIMIGDSVSTVHLVAI